MNPTLRGEIPRIFQDPRKGRKQTNEAKAYLFDIPLTTSHENLLEAKRSVPLERYYPTKY